MALLLPALHACTHHTCIILWWNGMFITCTVRITCNPYICIMVFTTLCRSAHWLWSYQQQQQSSSQPLIWWATYLLYTIMILQILFKSYSWRLFLNVFNFRKAALCWKLNLWKRVTTYYKHTMSSPSGCTVAANKKFPFRFRGTAVQRFAVDKKR